MPHCATNWTIWSGRSMSFSHPNTITVTFLPIKIKLKRGALTLLFMDMRGGEQCPTQCSTPHSTIITRFTRCWYGQHRICQMSSHTYSMWATEAPIGSILMFVAYKYKRSPSKNWEPIAWNQFSIGRKEERSSAATAYIELARNNPHFLINTWVAHVLLVGNGSHFWGVELTVDVKSPRKHIVGSKEVIFAGGIISTLQILLNPEIRKLQRVECKNLTDQVTSLVM